LRRGIRAGSGSKRFGSADSLFNSPSLILAAERRGIRTGLE